MTVKEQTQKLLDDLNKGVYEKQEVTALTLLTAIAGESIFLLGAPGVAKSLIARRLKFAFADKDGKKPIAFEYLMNRFSTPDEIFGPVSISKLKDKDKYERIVENYLPSATVVFLDEIWKAGPSIQNALLTVLNEKIYRNGEQEIKNLPIKAIISASNELPMKDQGLEALWDRFLVRYVADSIQDKNNFNEMISKSLKSYEDNIDKKIKIGDTEYAKWDELIDGVNVPENIFNVIHIIRSYIVTHNKKDEKKKNQIYISDRRWKKIIRLLRTSAFLNDRKVVDLMDCFLIAHCIWNEAEQFETVLQFTKDAIRKHGYTLSLNLSDIKDELKDFDDDVKEETSFLKEVKVEEPQIMETNYYQILNFDYTARIEISVYKTLTTTSDNNIYLYIISNDYYNRNSYRQNGHYRVRKGKKNHIIINGTEYALQTTTKTDKKKATKKPHSAVKKEWDKKVKIVLTTTGNLKSQVERYRSNDLKHLRVNLFVNSELADVVESNLNETQKEIEKLEVEVNKIQHYYENVEDQTDNKEIKQLTNGKEK